jgi:hypothetical protein
LDVREEKIIMRPVTIWSLSICVIVAFAAFIVSILFDFHKLDVTVWWSAIKNGGVLAALTFGLVHFLSSRPKIFSYTQSDWEVRGENWSDVFIKIPKSKHGRGKYPKLDFIRLGGYSNDTLGLTHKVEENGDITICHDQNRFMRPWKDFSVKITM